MSSPSPLLLRAADIAARARAYTHPWNPNSAVSTTFLGRALGLTRTGVNLARIAPGKESFLPHAHHREEEWIYILSGRGVAEIDGVDHDVGPGDFMAFPAPSVVHHLRNASSDDDLVYLMGGENLDFEVEDFPTVGKRMLKRGEKMDIYDLPGPKRPAEDGA